MATLKKIKLKNEKELHSVIEKELEALEEGLTILKYEFAMSKGVPDFLCVDSGRTKTYYFKGFDIITKLIEIDMYLQKCSQEKM